jgi:hypothetical protein
MRSPAFATPTEHWVDNCVSFHLKHTELSLEMLQYLRMFLAF